MSVSVEQINELFKIYSIEKCTSFCHELEGEEAVECMKTCVSISAK